MTLTKLCLPLAVAVALAGCNNEPKQADVQSETVKEVEVVEATPSGTLPAKTTPTETSTSETMSQDSTQNMPTYKLVIESAYPPYAFKDEQGNLVGFDVDVLKAAGDATGFDVEVTTVPWDGIFDTLNSGESDIVGSGISVTTERMDDVDFTDPYISAKPVVAYLSDESKTFEDLKAGKFGIQADSSYKTNLIENLKIDAGQIVEYSNAQEAFDAMLNKEVDGVVDENSIINYQVQAMRDQMDINSIRMASIPISAHNSIAFAVKKGRTDLVSQLNDGLSEISQNGEYNKIFAKWFGDVAFDNSK